MVTDLLAEMSEWTWRFLADASFRPREETITESLLVDLQRRGPGRVWVYKATSSVESRAGLDWAWALRTRAGWATMLVQAKQADGKQFAVYPELRKKDAKDQVEHLIHAAAMASALPVYAFYQGVIHPFGQPGESTEFGGCARRVVTRGVGVPWIDSTSPLGITVAHAADVLDHAVPAPAANQRAATVNEYGMPLECLLCPKLRSTPSSSGAWRTRNTPRILEAAALLATLSADSDLAGEFGERPADSLTIAAWPTWIQPEQPNWVDSVIEGIEPGAYQDDVPSVQYYVVTDLTPPQGTAEPRRRALE